MYAKVLKANPFHDASGRFSSKDKAINGGAKVEDRLDTAAANLSRADAKGKMGHDEMVKHLEKAGHSNGIAVAAAKDRLFMRSITSSIGFRQNASLHSQGD